MQAHTVLILQRRSCNPPRAVLWLEQFTDRPGEVTKTAGWQCGLFPLELLDENMPRTYGVLAGDTSNTSPLSGWHTNIVHDRRTCRCLRYYQFGWSWSFWRIKHRCDLRIAVTPGIVW